MTTINTYQNGNTTVTLMSDGTKIREYEGTPIVFHPESIAEARDIGNAGKLVENQWLITSG